MYRSKTTMAIIILFVVAAVLITCNRCNPPQVGDTGVNDPIDTSSWITSGGDIVSSLKGSQEAFGQIDHREADSIAQVYKTRESDLKEYIVALEHANADLRVVPGTAAADYRPWLVPGGDSCPPQVRRMRQQFANPYYTADVQLGDSPYLRLDARDTLTAVWKRVTTGNIFNRRRLIQLDLSTANPDIRIYGLQAYRQMEAVPKKWAISLQAGRGFVFESNQVRGTWYAGIGISRSLIRF